MIKKINLFKSLSDRTRLRILMSLLTHKELCACQIIELLQFSGATISKHLSLLNNARLIKSRKEGRWIYFSLRNDNSENKKILTWIFENLKKDKDYLEDCKKLKSILACDPIALCKKQRDKNCC